MADFIFKANIAHFNELLGTETDARKIEMLRNLLAEEEAKYADWRAKGRRSQNETCSISGAEIDFAQGAISSFR